MLNQFILITDLSPTHSSLLSEALTKEDPAIRATAEPFYLYSVGGRLLLQLNAETLRVSGTTKAEIHFL